MLKELVRSGTELSALSNSKYGGMIDLSHLEALYQNTSVRFFVLKSALPPPI
jgi:hypothetical protein